jgi:hypothetical protein
MIAPRPIGVLLADPSGVAAGRARHVVKSFGSGGTAAAAALSEIARLRSRARFLRPVRSQFRQIWRGDAVRRITFHSTD